MIFNSQPRTGASAANSLFYSRLLVPILAMISLVMLLIGCAHNQQQTLDSTVRFQDSGSGYRPATQGSDSRGNVEPQLFGGGQATANGSDTRQNSNSNIELDRTELQARKVLDVRIKGNQLVPTHQLMRHVRTRPGRFFDQDILQQDVDQLWRHSAIRRVNGPYLQRTAEGIIVEIEVIERKYVNSVKFIGNRAIIDRKLRETTGIQANQPLDVHAVRMAKQRIEELYREKGYSRTQVELVEGSDSNDSDVVFLIHEDVQQKIFRVTFEGNTVASSARLGSLVESKAGILWIFGGSLNRDEVDQDIVRLTTYYRNLGYFNARIGRELKESQNGSWVTIHYVIDEGPRYRIRNVSFVGNDFYAPEQLLAACKLRTTEGESPFFHSAIMNQDVHQLNDAYGTQGFVFANVQAEPRFLEEPGWLDLVYRIEEGKRYRIGEINVVINGDYGTTKRKVVLDRLGMQPGDWLDTRKLEAAKGRLARSQLFADGSGGSPGAAPQIAVKPPEFEEGSARRY